MLKTNSKVVKERIREHILDTYSVFDLRVRVDDYAYIGTDFEVAQHLVQIGDFLTYIPQARNFLKEVLEETDEEANKYSADKVWDLYKLLLAREIIYLIK